MDDALEWARWRESADMHVALTEVWNPVLGHRMTVSTVFLGVDHRCQEEGPPVLYETMVFGGPCDQEQWRYTSWDDAEAGHRATVEALTGAIPVHTENGT